MIALREFQKRPRVLVGGEGLTALEAASQLIAFGYEVLLVFPEAELQVVHSLLPEDQEMPGYARDLAERLENRGEGFSFSGNSDQVGHRVCRGFRGALTVTAKRMDGVGGGDHPGPGVGSPRNIFFRSP